MPSIQQSLDALDSMVTNHASTPEIRSQIAHIAREVAALEADYVGAIGSQSHLAKAQLQRDNDVAAQSSHKVGVTLKNGKTVYYDANTYALLPNKNAPVTIEFRMLDKTKHTYREVGHAQWADVSEVHEPAG